jgi:DNA modification methylase
MKLYKGECLEVMDELIAKGVVVDAIITDPPYQITACKWDSVIPFDAMWLRLNKLIKPNGAIVLFGSEPFSSALRMSNVKNFKYDWVWNKVSCGNPFIAKHQPLKITELVHIFSSFGKANYFPIMIKGKMKAKGGKAKSKLFGVETVSYKNDLYYPKNLIEFTNNNNLKKQHPTQKPILLMEYLIRTYTNENELVLDFTMGSGTTGVACKNLNRDFIGIEIDKDYFEIAKKRVEQHQPQLKLIKDK